MSGQKEIEQTFDDLFNALNYMGNEENVVDALNTVLSKQHRTLQQNFFRYVVVTAINKFEEKYQDNNFDDRNRDSCELAHALFPIVKKAHLPFI